MSLEGKMNMVHVYLYYDIKKWKPNHAWQHEIGQKLFLYAKSLPENERLKYSNISHSGCYVTVAFADAPVGVDVEVRREINARVIDKTFSIREQRLLNDAGCTLTPIQLWTLKESYGKSKGVGIAYPLKDVEFAPVQYKGMWQRYTCSDENVSCYGFMTMDYALSVCVQNSAEIEPCLNVTKRRLDVT